MPTRYAKELIKELESLGYEFDRTNAKAMHVYVRPGVPDLIVNPSANENTARQILRQVKRSLGCADEVAKRNPAQIKERQAADREKAAGEIDRIQRKREAILASHQGPTLTRRQARLIEALDREERHWRSLMTETSVSASHRGTGQPRHRSGATS